MKNKIDSKNADVPKNVKYLYFWLKLRRVPILGDLICIIDFIKYCDKRKQIEPRELLLQDMEEQYKIEKIEVFSLITQLINEEDNKSNWEKENLRYRILNSNVIKSSQYEEFRRWLQTSDLENSKENTDYLMEFIQELFKS